MQSEDPDANMGYFVMKHADLASIAQKLMLVHIGHAGRTFCIHSM